MAVTTEGLIMLTITLILALLALVAVASATGRAPLWVAVVYRGASGGWPPW